MRDFALGADARGVVGDAAAVGPSAWAAARAERDPCAVGCMAFRRPGGVVGCGNGAREVDPPVEMRCVGFRHHGVCTNSNKKLRQRIIQQDNSQRERLLTVPDHVAKHSGVSWNSA